MAVAIPTTVSLTILARVGDSTVLNEIGTVEVTATPTALGPNAAVEAEGAFELDLASTLREMADEIDRQQAEAARDPHAIVSAAVAEHEAARRAD